MMDMRQPFTNDLNEAAAAVKAAVAAYKVATGQAEAACQTRNEAIATLREKERNFKELCAKATGFVE